MYIEKTLKSHPYANCKIIVTDEYIYLKSYSTIVLEYDTIRQIITCSGLYSRTTIKHIGWFMKQLFNNKFTYHDIKRCYEKNQSLFIGR